MRYAWCLPSPEHLRCLVDEALLRTHSPPWAALDRMANMVQCITSLSPTTFLDPEMLVRAYRHSMLRHGPKGDPNERDAGVVDEIVAYVTRMPPRSFFLFAGAGSGKTRTLVAVLRKLTGIGTRDEQREPVPTEDQPAVRFARELRARAQTIRVITYTKNAALVVTGRLGANDLTQVATIHSFCWELIATVFPPIQMHLPSSFAARHVTLSASW